MAKPSSLPQRIIYLAQTILLLSLLAIFRLLPLSLASAIGGKLGEWIGPFLKWHRIAEFNLHYACPEWDELKRQNVLRGMWNNLGRNFAEVPRLGHTSLGDRIKMDDTTRKLIGEARNENHPAIFFSAHIGNWELTPWFGYLGGTPLTLIYRHLNNPYIERIFYAIRRRYCDGLYPKGKTGARALLKVLQKKQEVGLLVDQKQNDGEPIEFFGHPAPTATAIAELAIKFDAVLYPSRCIRTKGCHFIAESQHMEIPEGISAQELMTRINQKIESWIREHPEQWLWVHQRWGKISELKQD